MSDKEQKAASEVDEKAQPKIRASAVKPLAGADFITAIVLIVFGTAFFINAQNMTPNAKVNATRAGWLRLR